MPKRETEKPNPRNFKNRNKLTFRIRKDGLGNFRWDLVTRNGAIIASSPDQGYNRIARCMASIGIIIENARESSIESPITKKDEIRQLSNTNYMIREDEL